jgi:GNAT superfamily N-acetyltransferase
VSAAPLPLPLPDGYEISTDKARLDVDVIYQYLSEDSYWSPGIAREVVERSIANSLCFGLYRGATQVGFARVVTDHALFGLLADVFVLPAHRGKGLSKALMQRVVEHEVVKKLRRFQLVTTDAHGLYRQFGFGEITEAWRYMEILRPDAHRSP